MSEARPRPLVAIVGLARDPTTQFRADVERLKYQTRVIAWPAERLKAGGRPLVATVVDFRALGVDAEQACRAVQGEPTLRRAPVIALVFEQEGARLDMSLGFDDLILAPYRLAELAARLRLARSRLAVLAPAEDVIAKGPLTVNPATYEVFAYGAPIELTLKEYQLLLFLVQNPGRVFTREQLLSRVWGDDYYGGTRTVDVHIRRLRAKTEPAGDFLETVRGVGYRFVPPPDEQT
jgi:DNA-binding response OmpR family regulator